jgi:endo-beta-N-acetylglucosaminidase D
MILECQQHPDYKRAVQTLLNLAEEYGRHGRFMAKEGSGTVKQTRTNLQQAQHDLKVR